MKDHLLKFGSKLRRSIAPAVAGTTALVASSAAMASATAGSAIAGELAGGGADMGLIFAAVAVLIGLLLLWSYTKRAAK